MSDAKQHRYVYFVAGHVRVVEHPSTDRSPAEPFVVLFSAVMRLPRPVTHASDEKRLSVAVSAHLATELSKAGVRRVDEPILRGVTHLHTLRFTEGADTHGDTFEIV